MTTFMLFMGYGCGTDLLDQWKSRKSESDIELLCKCFDWISKGFVSALHTSGFLKLLRLKPCWVHVDAFPLLMLYTSLCFELHVLNKSFEVNFTNSNFQTQSSIITNLIVIKVINFMFRLYLVQLIKSVHILSQNAAIEWDDSWKKASPLS